MACLKIVSFICVVVAFTLADNKVHYYGDKVFRITPQTEADVKFVHDWLEKMDDRVDVWKEASHVRHPIDVHIRANDVEEVNKVFNAAGLIYECTIQDLEKLIEHESKSNHNFAFFGGYNYFSYNRYDAIKRELQNLDNKYPNVNTFNVGRSYEGRDIIGVKVTGPGSNGMRKAIWVDGGIHAREWISPATVMYTLKQLLGPDPLFQRKVKEALSKYDFYILPVFNVDGYEYSHSTNRMWRKTRSYDSSNQSGWRKCYGVDPNRNWDSHFGGAGTSSNPCSDLYRGTKPFSEVEVKQVSDYLEKIDRNVGLVSYWNVHAYSELLLFPWSYTTTFPVHYSEIKKVADKFANGAKLHGRYFKVGQPSRILYAVAGGSIDWVYEKLGVKYAYAPELRPGRGSRNGFFLPSRNIRPSGEEFTMGFLDAILAI